MLIDLLFLPVHVLVGAPDVALQILEVCNVLVVELVLTKNSFGFLAHLQQRAFCWACPQEHAQVVKLVSHSTRLQFCLLSNLYSQRTAFEGKDQQFMDYCSLSFGNGLEVATICLPEEMEFCDRWNFLTLRPATQKRREIL